MKPRNYLNQPWDWEFSPWEGCESVGSGCECCPVLSRRNTRTRSKLDYWRYVQRKHDNYSSSGPLVVYGSPRCDVLENLSYVQQWRRELWKLIDSTPEFAWVLTTKRPQNWSLLPMEWIYRPPDNLWMGLSVSNQASMEDRAPLFLETFAKFSKVLVYQPVLGPLTLDKCSMSKWDWLWIGGECDYVQHARVLDLSWIRSALGWADLAGVPAYVITLGSRWADTAAHDIHGGNPDYWPEDLKRFDVPDGMGQ